MDWHARFLQQAGWTRPLRVHLFERAGLSHARRLLEVGCGTGAILPDLPAGREVIGLDLDGDRLREAQRRLPLLPFVRADGMQLPWRSGAFDITFCHFLLLWVRDPTRVLEEMKRVTRPGGAILALAEPDYDARIDEPAFLASLGRWQADALRRQGADPGLGRRLADLFQKAGIQLIETGTLQESPAALSPQERRLEWQVIESDLSGFVPKRELQRMKRLDARAWRLGVRRLHIPTYYAFGLV